jgi:hypothetical protein
LKNALDLLPHVWSDADLCHVKGVSAHVRG